MLRTLPYCITLLFCVLLATPASAVKILASQQSALLEAKSLWGGFRSSDSWHAGSDCSTWVGVSCDALGHVIGLDLSYSNINGTFPPSFKFLSFLKSLNLLANDLHGTLPGPVLASLHALEELLLSSNAFSGPVPPGIASLSVLSSLRLDMNQLTGPIPTALCSAKSLWAIDLSSNAFSGPIPSCLGNMKALATIQLPFNRLSGPIPSSFVRLSNLELLDLRNNTLSGPIPIGLGSLPLLSKLVLSYNLLSGRLPENGTDFGPSIRTIILAHNKLTGPVPRVPTLSLHYRPGTVPVTLDLSYNYFFGSPILHLGSDSFCPSQHRPFLGVNRNCLAVSGCPTPLQNPPQLCHRFCGTGTKEGQCSGHGTCTVLLSGQGLRCECDPGFKLSPTSNLSCVKI